MQQMVQDDPVHKLVARINQLDSPTFVRHTEEGSVVVMKVARNLLVERQISVSHTGEGIVVCLMVVASLLLVRHHIASHTEGAVVARSKIVKRVQSQILVIVMYI